MLRFELGQLDTLVELTVVDNNGRLPTTSGRVIRRGLPLRLHDDLVVDAELAFRHARKVRLHHHLASNVSREDLALRRHEEVDVLEHVQEELVPPILDALAAPANLPSHLS